MNYSCFVVMHTLHWCSLDSKAQRVISGPWAVACPHLSYCLVFLNFYCCNCQTYPSPALPSSWICQFSWDLYFFLTKYGVKIPLLCVNGKLNKKNIFFIELMFVLDCTNFDLSFPVKYIFHYTKLDLIR